MLTRIFLSSLLAVNLFSSSEFDIDNLLQNIEKKTDLSEKTKLANSGVYTIYTRDDIDRMQIKSIKDILKLTYPIGYNENRYGIVDPLTMGSIHPFTSSQIKVYIDNQEITTALYGSGLSVISGLGVEWADHIEIYTQAPTYEYSSESTVTLIKLYTKSVIKDEGNKISLTKGSYGSSKLSFYRADEIDKWSYFVFGSKYDINRKEYSVGDGKVSRDSDLDMILATLKNGENNIFFTAISQKRDTFLDKSIDGTPTDAYMDGEYIHIGYDTKIDNFTYLISYNYMKYESYMQDDATPIQTAPYYGMFPLKSYVSINDSEVINNEFKYNIDTKEHKLLMGLKFKIKRYNYDTITINGVDIPIQENDQQTVLITFIEDQYLIKENSIITFGIQTSNINNNHSNQDDDLFMYRLGYTYTNNNLTLKTIGSHTQVALDPYLVNSKQFLAYPDEKYDTRDFDTILENIIYETNKDKQEFIVDYNIAKNYLTLNDKGKYITYDEDIIMKGINYKWTHYYNSYNKLYIDFGLREITNIPIIDKLITETIILRDLHSYNRFDFFNQILIYKDDYENQRFYDYSAGVQYHYSDDLTFSMKGLNILNKAKTTTYIVKDLDTQQPKEILEASAEDKFFMITMEYTF